MIKSKQPAETVYKEVKIFSIEAACESHNIFKNLCDVIETHPDESARNLGMSIVHHLIGNHDKSLTCLKFLINNHSEQPLLHRRIAEIYIHYNQFDRAVEHLEKTLSLDKDDFTATIWLGLIHYELGNKNKARICLNLLRGEIFFLHALNAIELENI